MKNLYTTVINGLPETDTYENLIKMNGDKLGFKFERVNITLEKIDNVEQFNIPLIGKMVYEITKQ